MLGFHEKNPEAPTMPGDPEQVYASMGNYVFQTQTLIDLLEKDSQHPESNHDFGRDILPKLAGKAEIFAYDFQTNRIPGEKEDAKFCRSWRARPRFSPTIFRPTAFPAKRRTRFPTGATWERSR